MKFNSRNLYVSPKSRIGRNVRLGDNSVIYDNVEIGDDSIICNDSVIGEPLAAYYRDSEYDNPPTIIGPGALIRSHCIIYAGCRFGAGLSTGHRVTIRENSVIGDNCLIGTMCDLQGDLQIGNYCRLYSNVHIAKTSTIGHFVFFYPFSMMTNDPYPPSNDIKGGCIGNYTQIGVHSVILSGIQVGENCLVGANTVVNKNLKDFFLVSGNPLNPVDIRKYFVMGKGKLYPWMYRFERGMPWEGIGFESWMSQTIAKQSQPL